jgi:glyoxalase family protein
MPKLITGIHHVTAIAGDPQANIDFYVKLLGLRLVKRTVNFDDPFTYHFYFGDDVGHPGTLLTFFPWSAAAHRGRKGAGQIVSYAFSIPHESLPFWTERLRRHRVDFSGPAARFDTEVVTAADHDGFTFELVASERESRPGWEGSTVPAEHAIRGFHNVTLLELAPEKTAEFLASQSLQFTMTAEAGNRFRFEIGSDTFIDVEHRPAAPRGYMGAGIVHHVAFRTPGDETQLEVQDQLLRQQVGVTAVIDRNYFHSIYFNEPGGVIFEVATDPPGFLIDEEKENLGTELKLPLQYESDRAEIESRLPSVTLPAAVEVRS